MDIAEIKKEWVGFTFDTAEFKVEEQAVLEFAAACGETEPRYTDSSHPDFRAPANFTACFLGRRVFPENFPKLGKGFPFDAGKCVQVHAPVRVGDVLTARSSLYDIYEKTGRSGSMAFIVHRMEFTDQHDEPVTTVDWRMVHAMGKK
jgi:hypothetical protein